MLATTSVWRGTESRCDWLSLSRGRFLMRKIRPPGHPDGGHGIGERNSLLILTLSGAIEIDVFFLALWAFNRVELAG